MSVKENYRQGAVAIFSVIFATLLVTIVIVSFLALMISDQRQSTNVDLSESAYDSALAGVEDAKRLVARYNECLASSTEECQKIKGLFKGKQKQTDCLAIIAGGIAGSEGDREVIVGGDEAEGFDQAYTCVKLAINTPDYLGALPAGFSGSVVPLKGVGSFRRINISWYSQSDSGSLNVELPNVSGSSDTLPLPSRTEWGKATPAVLRLTAINFNGIDSLSDFNESSRASTVFLYPSSAGIGATASINIRTNDSPRNLNNLDNLRVSGSGAKAVNCSSSLQPLQEYFCRATIDLGASTNLAYLGVSSLYNASDYRIELQTSSGNTVLFDNVQPSADSTGRANDIFRRVEARLEMRNSMAYPDSAISTVGDICKDFLLTDKIEHFASGCI